MGLTLECYILVRYLLPRFSRSCSHRKLIIMARLSPSLMYILVLALFATVAYAYDSHHELDVKLEHQEVDQPDSCLKNIRPPKFVRKWLPHHDTKWYVENAKEGASRCCGEGLSECRCPIKNFLIFKKKIAAHC